MNEWKDVSSWEINLEFIHIDLSTEQQQHTFDARKS